MFTDNTHTVIKEYVSKYFDIRPGINPQYIHCMYHGISLGCWEHNDRAEAHRVLVQIVCTFSGLQLAGVIFKEDD